MDEMLRRWKGLNERANDIPRRMLLIALVIGVCFLAVALFPLCWPFVVALLFAMLMEPLVRLLRRAFHRLPMGKNLATLLGMLVLFGLLGWLLQILIGRLISEILSLARATPGMLRWLSSNVTTWVTELTQRYTDVLPENLMEVTNATLGEISKTLVGFATDISGTIASGAWATAMSVPTMLLTIVLTIMATYYISSDRERIFAYFRRTFPAGVVKKGVLLKRNIFKALFGQAKAQLLVSLLITLVVIVGLMMQKKPYALLLGLLIGVCDALPVLGAGLILTPWALIGFFTGDTATGVGMALVYLATIVVRQIAEPRIVGRSLGLYPLATMMAIFAGFKITGNFLGMLLGPILLNICKVVLEADRGEVIPPAAPPLKLTFKRRQPKKDGEDGTP